MTVFMDFKESTLSRLWTDQLLFKKNIWKTIVNYFLFSQSHKVSHLSLPFLLKGKIQRSQVCTFSFPIIKLESSILTSRSQERESHSVWLNPACLTWLNQLQSCFAVGENPMGSTGLRESTLLRDKGYAFLDWTNILKYTENYHCCQGN